MARAFGRTVQTVDNWRKGRSRAGGVPRHLILCCEGYEAMRRDTGMVEPAQAPLTPMLFEMWRSHHGLGTLESVARVFGVTRQAVHNWQTRRNYPRWLNMACHGYGGARAAVADLEPRTGRRRSRLDSQESETGQS